MTIRTFAAALAGALLTVGGALAEEAAPSAAAAPAAAAEAGAPATPAAEAPPAAATPPAPKMVPLVIGGEGAAPITIGEPPAGKGQIVFFRPSGQGMLINCTIHEGDAQISKLGDSKYFILTAEPGPHKYMVRSEAKDELTLEVEPGETYFVRCSIGMGIIAGRPNLAPSDKALFDKKSKHLKLQKVAAPAPTPSAAAPAKSG
jgi:hypothetical protein